MKIVIFLLLFTLQLMAALVCTPLEAAADENVTNGELLQLYFKIELHEYGPREFNIIQFHPIAGPADKKRSAIH
jgi:hypothetical protein